MIRQSAMKQRIIALLMGIFAASISAMNESSAAPLTPHLSEETQSALLSGLAQAGLPDVAHNSVVIAITGGLGLKPTSGIISYSTAYAHLPTVKGEAIRISETCSRIEARAWMPTEREKQAVLVEGTYCLTGAALWTSSDQTVRRLKE